MSVRVLVIDDNEQNLYLVSYLLEHAGYEVLRARDGLTGLRLAQAEMPALVVLDIQLPGMDGFEVARRLRADRVLGSIPIVAVTSFAMTGDRERVMAAGCSAYLEKPIDPERFIHSINDCLPRKEPR